MQLGGHIIGVCSWSLHPKGARDLVALLRRLELSHVQIALMPLLVLDEEKRQAELSVLRDAGIEFTAGMMSYPGEDYSTISIIKQTGGFVPDDLWSQRREMSFAAADLAKQ